MQSLASFVDELAESADRLLEDLVVIEIFEEAAGHSQFSASLKNKIGFAARRLLERVEKDCGPW